MPHWRKPFKKIQFKWPKPGEPGYYMATIPAGYERDYVLLYYRFTDIEARLRSEGYADINHYLDLGNNICGSARVYRPDAHRFLRDGGTEHHVGRIYSASPLTYEGMEPPEGYQIVTAVSPIPTPQDEEFGEPEEE